MIAVFCKDNIKKTGLIKFRANKQLAATDRKIFQLLRKQRLKEQSYKLLCKKILI